MPETVHATAADSIGEQLPGPSHGFSSLVRIDFARDHLVVSEGVGADGAELLAVSGRDEDGAVAWNLAARLGRPCRQIRRDAELIRARIDEMAERAAEREPIAGAGDIEQACGVRVTDVEDALRANDTDLLSTMGRAPLVKLLNGVLFEAVRESASDVHLQPRRDEVAVRFRIDGVLHDAHALPGRLLEPLVSRVKVMAEMDIAERRKPQDGRAVVSIAGKEIDLRVSSIPTALGERVVVRLLDKRRVDFFDLERLGMPGEVRAPFVEGCSRAHGMMLVTGPTGSGKTTTLYSMLRSLSTPGINVMTLEDPIEYELPGVSQSQVNPLRGLTFATGLRHVLRQDPDVIMVGEIRDTETARIAVQSALTGHMVFSTLHTNSAASAVTRLADLGIEPFLINASLTGVLAQRLVRTTCESCEGSGGDAGRRCGECRGVGYRGRVGLFEYLVVTERIRALVLEGASASALERCAVEGGMTTLRRAGGRAIAEGVTTADEVARVTTSAGEDSD